MKKKSILNLVSTLLIAFNFMACASDSENAPGTSQNQDIVGDEITYEDGVCESFDGTYKDENGWKKKITHSNGKIQIGEGRYEMELDGKPHQLYSSASRTYLTYIASCNESEISVYTEITDSEGNQIKLNQLYYLTNSGYEVKNLDIDLVTVVWKRTY